MKNATKLSKVNSEIQALTSSILEIESYEATNDFNTRDGHICANIRVYDWLDDDDVKKIIKDNDLQHAEEEILIEFDENRQNNIFNHFCETEVYYLKDKYENNCDLNNPYNELNLYKRFYNSKFKAYPLKYASIRDGKTGVLIKEWYSTNEFYYKSFIKFSKRKNNTPKDYLKDLKRHEKWTFEEWERRDKINFECRQYGRSGGWFSICENSEIEDQEFDYYNADLETEEDNNEFNRILREDMEVFSKDKRQFISDMKVFIKEWEKKKETIEYFVNEIEEQTKSFKEGLLDFLENEIINFVDEELSAEASNVSIKIEDEKIKTTLGVTVNLNAFKDAFNSVKDKLLKLEIGDKMPIKIRVGAYFVEYAKKVENDVLIKAGCHRFSLNNINQILKTS